MSNKVDIPYVGSCTNKDSSNAYIECLPFNKCPRCGASSELEISSAISNFNLNFYKDTVDDICEAIRNASMALSNDKSELVEAGMAESAALELEKQIDHQQLNKPDDKTKNSNDNSSANTDMEPKFSSISPACEKCSEAFHEILPLPKLKDENGNLSPTYSGNVTETTCESDTKSENISNIKTHPYTSPETCKFLSNYAVSAVSELYTSCLDEDNPFGILTFRRFDYEIKNTKENSSANTDIEKKFRDFSCGCGEKSFEMPTISKLKHGNMNLVPTYSSNVTGSTCKLYDKSESNILSDKTHPDPSSETTIFPFECPGSSSVSPWYTSCLAETDLFGIVNETTQLVDLCRSNKYSNEDNRNIPAEVADASATASATNNELNVPFIGKIQKMSVCAEENVPLVTAKFVDVSERDANDISMSDSASDICDTEPSSGVSFPKYDNYSGSSSSVAYDDLSDSSSSELSSGSNSVAPLLVYSESETSLVDETSTDESFLDDVHKFPKSLIFGFCPNCENLSDTSSEDESEDSHISWDESRSIGTSENASITSDNDEWSDESSSCYDSSETNSSDSDSSEDGSFI